jgi:prevent-host-death family protein
MTSYSLAEAKSHLSQVIAEVQAGKQVLITKHGQPAALLTQPKAIQTPAKRQLVGCMKAQFADWQMPDDFDRMGEQEIIALFEGGDRS